MNSATLACGSLATCSNGFYKGLCSREEYISEYECSENLGEGRERFYREKGLVIGGGEGGVNVLVGSGKVGKWKEIMPSALYLSRLLTGGSRTRSAIRRLGSNASGDLCCIGDLPAIHGFSSAVRRSVRWSNSQSPSLLPFCDLKRRFAVRASISATHWSNAVPALLWFFPFFLLTSLILQKQKQQRHNIN
ncbi:hypothetical protein HAX54_021425 [Datura stramonium]|uniref:Uncharacterized protein n=1 Tax=Datura stramonium TaxID=4076 RepID=A0ABS8UV50_DATST|nr:hypothetical protein [Datura stramonium]